MRAIQPSANILGSDVLLEDIFLWGSIVARLVVFMVKSQDSPQTPTCDREATFEDSMGKRKGLMRDQDPVLFPPGCTRNCSMPLFQAKGAAWHWHALKLWKVEEVKQTIETIAAAEMSWSRMDAVWCPEGQGVWPKQFPKLRWMGLTSSSILAAVQIVQTLASNPAAKTALCNPLLSLDMSWKR